MSSISERIALGFTAGALSHITFQGALGLLYYATGLIPGLPWSLNPLPPFGVPQTVNFAFWAGLWGIAYGLVQPRFSARFGLLTGGLIFGVAAMLARWFVVLPLKGLGVAEGLVPQAMFVYAGFHLVFGIGLALLYEVGRRLFAREAPVRAGAVRG